MSLVPLRTSISSLKNTSWDLYTEDINFEICNWASLKADSSFSAAKYVITLETERFPNVSFTFRESTQFHRQSKLFQQRFNVKYSLNRQSNHRKFWNSSRVFQTLEIDSEWKLIISNYHPLKLTASLEEHSETLEYRLSHSCGMLTCHKQTQCTDFYWKQRSMFPPWASGFHLERRVSTWSRVSATGLLTLLAVLPNFPQQQGYVERRQRRLAVGTQ